MADPTREASVSDCLVVFLLNSGANRSDGWRGKELDLLTGGDHVFHPAGLHRKGDAGGDSWRHVVMPTPRTDVRSLAPRGPWPLEPRTKGSDLANQKRNARGGGRRIKRERERREREKRRERSGGRERFGVWQRWDGRGWEKMMRAKNFLFSISHASRRPSLHARSSSPPLFPCYAVLWPGTSGCHEKAMPSSSLS